ncbi:putative RNA-binding protein Jag [Elusimicrobium posterum]|uniref:RNA-binding cell elongation regulator Jag/EloR n=1 Tax=Elusimicrobium posterum TaxID=3116653 RepID=UPI003C773F68
MAKKTRIEAKDVDSAISQGLKELGLRRDQAEVTVISRPTKGFLGIGAKPAVVEIKQKRWQGANLDSQIYMDVPKRKEFKKGGRGGNSGNRDNRDNRGPKNDNAKGDKKQNKSKFKFEKKEYGNVKKSNKKFGKRDFNASAPAEVKVPKENEPQLLPSLEVQNAVVPENLKAPIHEAREMLSQMLGHMGIKVENLNAWWDERQQRILLTFDCDHPAIVIGKEGKTLEALQYLLTLAISRHFSTPISVVADTQNYCRKAEDKLHAEINRAVAAIEKGSSVYRLKPMPAAMRRFIHRALADNAVVETESEGESKWRKVVIKQRTTPLGETAAKAPQPAAPVQEQQVAEQTQAEPQVQAEAQPVIIGETFVAYSATENGETVTVAETTTTYAVAETQGTAVVAVEEPKVEAQPEAAPVQEQQQEVPAQENVAQALHEQHVEHEHQVHQEGQNNQQ